MEAQYTARAQGNGQLSPLVQHAAVLVKFPVSRGVPIPPSRKPVTGVVKYPTLLLDVGESYFVPRVGKLWPTPSLTAGGGRKFISRRVNENGVDGIRVWRTA